jgi:hypothetical protein
VLSGAPSILRANELEALKHPVPYSKCGQVGAKLATRIFALRQAAAGRTFRSARSDLAYAITMSSLRFLSGILIAFSGLIAARVVRRTVMRKSQMEPHLTLAEFGELARQPYSQASLAELLHRWFGYSMSGSLVSTEVRSATGAAINLSDLYNSIQRDPVKKSMLGDLAYRLRR